MGLRFDPMGGGQFKRITQEIMEMERQPIKNLEARKGRESAKLQLFRGFKGKFGEMKTSLEQISQFGKFRELKADLGDAAGVMDVTIDNSKARPGSYRIEVSELAKTSAIISNGFEDSASKVLGIGYVVVHTKDGPFEVFVDESHSSLQGVAQLINEVNDSPVQAEVIQDMYDPDRSWRLILKARDEGYSNSIEFPEFYFFGGKEDFRISDEIEADNAFLKVDGFDIEAKGNDISDFFEGINIHLKEARPEKPFLLKVTVDTKKVTGKVQEFITKANEVLKFINDQNKIDDKTDTTQTFAGDTSMQSIEYRLRNLMHEGFPVGVKPNEDYDEDYRIIHMADLGIGFSRDGQLSFDEKKFEKMIDDDFEGVSEALTGSMGFGYQMNELLSMYTRPIEGLLAIRERGLQARIDSIDRNIGQKQLLLERKEKALIERFARLQGALANMQNQQQYMAATLGGGGGGNIVSQLLGG